MLLQIRFKCKMSNISEIPVGESCKIRYENADLKLQTRLVQLPCLMDKSLHLFDIYDFREKLRPSRFRECLTNHQFSKLLPDLSNKGREEEGVVGVDQIF